MSTKKDKTREHILEASYGLFAKNGFSRVTMKDICEVTELSRGGLYSHFSSTREVFEAILDMLNKKDVMNFAEEIEQGKPATEILSAALELMEDEMNHPEDSLSLAMYEYAGSVEHSDDTEVVGSTKRGLMDQFNKEGIEKWTMLVEYGIERGEFKKVDVYEIVNVILYAYQGVRMWSCIVNMENDSKKAIIEHIRKQLLI